MKTWISSIFGGDDSANSVRKLTHPRDLQPGDIIKFRYLPQAEISNKQFELVEVNTYDFKDRNLTEFVLQGDMPENIYLTVDETGDVPHLAICQKINRDLVEQLFDIDEFALLFDDESNNIIHRQKELPQLEGWTAPSYQQEIFSERGYFYKGDYRHKMTPQDEEQDEDFDYYLAIDDSRQYVIEAEVYSGGETDVLITVWRPLTDIEEMWPGAHG